MQAELLTCAGIRGAEDRKAPGDSKQRAEEGEGQAVHTHLPDPLFAAEATPPPPPSPHRCLSPLRFPKPPVEPALEMSLSDIVNPQKASAPLNPSQTLFQDPA